jgi:hypothetical protein
MTEWVSPYPTLSEISKRASFGIYAGKAQNPMLRRVLGWLRALG